MSEHDYTDFYISPVVRSATKMNPKPSTIYKGLYDFACTHFPESLYTVAF